MGDVPQPGGGGPDDERPGFPFGPGFGGAAPFGPGGFDLSRMDMSQVMRMLQSEGPVNWEIASQVATWVATNGEPEAPIDEHARDHFEELAGAARAHVVTETGLTTAFQAPVQTPDRAA